MSVHKFDIICLSETYLDSTVSLDDDNLVSSENNLSRSDHPSNTKRGGVLSLLQKLFTTKSSLSLRLAINLVPLLPLIGPQAKTSDNFEMTLETLAQKGSFLTRIIGDFNAKSCNWNSHDKTRFEGGTIESITSQFGLHQLINEPTHLLENSSSCIDLIFTSQPNIVVESGVHPSLHPNCHLQIIFVKFNLKIYYPPPYIYYPPP